jgi:hypothetical protein
MWTSFSIKFITLIEKSAHTHLQSPTPSLALSEDFYSKLNFQAFVHEGNPFYSDGKSNILINPERTASAGMVIEVNNLAEFKSQSSRKKVHFEERKDELFLSCPSGIITHIKAFKNKLPKAEEKPSVLGNAAGLTIESNDTNASVNFYRNIGFKITTGTAENGWLVMKNESGFGMSLLKTGTCPYLFFNPSISYFNGKEGNPIVIENIRKFGLPIAEEVTHFNKKGEVDNVIMRARVIINCRSVKRKWLPIFDSSNYEKINKYLEISNRTGILGKDEFVEIEGKEYVINNVKIRFSGIFDDQTNSYHHELKDLRTPYNIEIIMEVIEI